MVCGRCPLRVCSAPVRVLPCCYSTDSCDGRSSLSVVVSCVVRRALIPQCASGLSTVEVLTCSPLSVGRVIASTCTACVQLVDSTTANNS